MTNLQWCIKTESLPIITLNIGKYTSIYNEYETIEEDLLNVINQYFKKRNSNKSHVTIAEMLNQEEISPLSYESIIIDNRAIDNEFLLSSNSIINKKLQRDFYENIESSSYIESINVLFEDLLNLINKTELPLKIKAFDIKQFIKLLSFEYSLNEDYSKLIVRIEQILPLLVEELNKQYGGKLLLIYLYPEANLSPKEQIRLKELIISLGIDIIVLTGSLHFLAEDWKYNNYIRCDNQKISSELVDNLLWNAPLNFERSEIEQSLNQFILAYQDKIEIKPIISNYQIAQIMLFSSIDLYVGVSYMQHCNHEFILNIDETKLPLSMAKYLEQFVKEN